MKPTTKLRKIRKDINGKTINKGNVVQRFQKYLTKKECARAEKLGKWAKTFSKYESEFTIKDINRFIEIYEIQYKVKAITKSTYTNEIKALEDLKPNKIEDIFTIDRLRTDPRRKENRTKKSVSNYPILYTSLIVLLGSHSYIRHIVLYIVRLLFYRTLF